MIITAFVVVMLAQFAAVAWFKHIGRQQAEQRLAELQDAESPHGSDVDVRMILDLLADPAFRDPASRTLTRMLGGDYINEILVEQLEKVKNFPVSVPLIQVLGQRRAPNALEPLLKMTNDTRGEVRKAAWAALGRIATAEELPKVLALVRNSNPLDQKEIEKALTSSVETAMDRPAATRHLLASYKKSKDHAESRALLFNVLTRVGGDEALPVVNEAIADSSEKVRLAAITVLAEYPTHEPLAAISKRFPDEEHETCRVYLLLAARELIGNPGPYSQQVLYQLAQNLYTHARDTTEKRYVLSVMSRIISPGTAKFFEDFAQSADASLQEEARELAKAFREKLDQVVPVPVSGRATLTAETADYRLGSSLTVDNGALVNWNQEGDWASWLVDIPQNGDYEIGVYQSHTNDHLGTYEALLAGQALLTAVVETGGTTDFKGFVAGAVKVEKPGIYRVRIRVKKLPPEGDLFRVQKVVVWKR